MDKIIDFFKQWDKLAHASLACVIMLVTTAVCTLWMNYWAAVAVGTVVTAACAFGKELYDKLRGKVLNWKDIIACAVGWAFALIPMLVIGFKLVATF